MKPAAELAAEPAAEPTPAEEMAVLFPDLDVPIHDPDTGEAVTVTVRELRFLEGLRLAAVVRPLIEAFAGSVCAGADIEIDESTIAAAFTDHAEAWLACLAQATGRDAGWLARLSDRDGQALSAAMWDANGDFFGRRLIEAVRRRRKAGPSHLPKSSMPSCAPATDTDTRASPSA